MKQKKVILDVDTGSDDAVAIMSAVLCKELEVLGVIATFGNQALEYTLDNTLRVAEMLGRPIPVFRGAAKPLARDLQPGRANNARPCAMEKVIDGKMVSVHDRTLPLPAPTLQPQEEPGALWLLRTLKESKEKITLIPVGPMTNIATVLRMDPSAAEKIEEIVCMGGGVHVHNITASAEINFFNDPEAANILLQSGVPTTVVTLDATHSSWFGYDEADQIAALDNPAARFASNMLRHRIDSALAIGNRKVPKSALHDVLAVCAVIDKGVLDDVRQEKCDVDIAGGWSDGALIVDDRPVAVAAYPTYIAYHADSKRLLEMLLEHLSRF